MNKLFLLLLSALCLASCNGKFLFDKIYEDEALFDLKVTIGAPKDITSDGAVIPVKILTDETITSCGVMVAADPHSSTLTPLPYVTAEKEFDVPLAGFKSDITIYVRGYCTTTGGKTYLSLEKSFKTRK